MRAIKAAVVVTLLTLSASAYAGVFSWGWVGRILHGVQSW